MTGYPTRTRAAWAAVLIAAAAVFSTAQASPFQTLDLPAGFTALAAPRTTERETLAGAIVTMRSRGDIEIIGWLSNCSPELESIRPVRSTIILDENSKTTVRGDAGFIGLSRALQGNFGIDVSVTTAIELHDTWTEELRLLDVETALRTSLANGTLSDWCEELLHGRQDTLLISRALLARSAIVRRNSGTAGQGQLESQAAPGVRIGGQAEARDEQTQQLQFSQPMFIAVACVLPTAILTQLRPVLPPDPRPRLRPTRCAQDVGLVGRIVNNADLTSPDQLGGFFVGGLLGSAARYLLTRTDFLRSRASWLAIPMGAFGGLVSAIDPANSRQMQIYQINEEILGEFISIQP
jgi:hypothetical protein